MWIQDYPKLQQKCFIEHVAIAFTFSEICPKRNLIGEEESGWIGRETSIDFHNFQRKISQINTAGRTNQSQLNLPEQTLNLLPQKWLVCLSEI